MDKLRLVVALKILRLFKKSTKNCKKNHHKTKKLNKRTKLLKNSQIKKLINIYVLD